MTTAEVFDGIDDCAPGIVNIRPLWLHHTDCHPILSDELAESATIEHMVSTTPPVRD